MEKDPDSSYVYFNLGTAFTETGLLAKAKQSLERFFELEGAKVPDPALPPGAMDHTLALAHHSLGRVDRDLGVFEEAAEHLRKAIKMSPRPDAPLLNDLGTTYMLLKNNEKALKALKRAIAIDPKYDDAYVNIANVYSDMKDHEESAVWFRRSFTVSTKKHAGRFASYLHELQCLGDWSEYYENFSKLRAMIAADAKAQASDDRRRELAQELPKRNTGYAVGPLTALMLPFTAAEVQEIASMYVVKFRKDRPDLQAMTSWPKSGDGSGVKPARLRVAYYSANFGHHVAASTIQGVFGQHDRSKFEIWAISAGKNDGSPTYKRIQREAEHHVSLENVPYLEQAQRISELGLHILIDMDGYTQGTKRELFSIKPAPLQVLLMGYVGTTGDSVFDYTVADAVTLPPEQGRWLTEGAALQPGTYFVSDYRTSFADQLPRIEHESRAKRGLPEEGTLFCNFNRHRKFDPLIFHAWMLILERAPGSHLWLLEFDDAKDRMLALAREHGIDAERFIFAGRYPAEEHLAVKSMCDLFLDSPVYNAHTTGTDALWAGVPVLSLPLDRMSSRVSASLILNYSPGGATKECDMEALVASSVESYIATAVRVHEDKEWAQSLRKCVEAGRYADRSIFDLAAWVSGFERSLEAMWEAKQAQRGRVHLVPSSQGSAAPPRRPVVVTQAEATTSKKSATSGGAATTAASSSSSSSSPSSKKPKRKKTVSVEVQVSEDADEDEVERVVREVVAERFGTHSTPKAAPSKPAPAKPAKAGLDALDEAWEEAQEIAEAVKKDTSKDKKKPAEVKKPTPAPPPAPKATPPPPPPPPPPPKPTPTKKKPSSPSQEEFALDDGDPNSTFF